MLPERVSSQAGWVCKVALQPTSQPSLVCHVSAVPVPLVPSLPEPRGQQLGEIPPLPDDPKADFPFGSQTTDHPRTDTQQNCDLATPKDGNVFQIIDRQSYGSSPLRVINSQAAKTLNRQEASVADQSVEFPPANPILTTNLPARKDAGYG